MQLPMRCLRCAAPDAPPLRSRSAVDRGVIVAFWELWPKRNIGFMALSGRPMLQPMNAPDPIPPFHRQGRSNAGDAGQGLPRAVVRTDAAQGHVERVSTLVHELDNLLDGSLRCVGLAVRTLEKPAESLALAEIDAVRRQLQITAEALERMASLVHAAMMGRAAAIGTGWSDGRPTVTLREALEHAADVTRLAASEHATQVHVEVDDTIGEMPAGTIYPCVLNGIRNAIESIEAAGGRGQVLIRAVAERTTPSRPTTWVRLEILDDGGGLPARIPAHRLFDAGFTTKSDGHGIGLALARSVLEKLGGHAEINTRQDRNDSRRPGAVLILRYPIEHDRSDRADHPSPGGRR